MRKLMALCPLLLLLTVVKLDPPGGAMLGKRTTMKRTVITDAVEYAN